MTDTEIIKALECCQSEDADMCKICPFHSYTHSGCWYEMHKDALDLINRQKAEIERLKGWQDLLKAEKHSLIKAEAVKEFADKVLLYIPNIEGDTTIKCVEEAIKQTLKETVGDV